MLLTFEKIQPKTASFPFLRLYLDIAVFSAQDFPGKVEADANAILLLHLCAPIEPSENLRPLRLPDTDSLILYRNTGVDFKRLSLHDDFAPCWRILYRIV